VNVWPTVTLEGPVFVIDRSEVTIPACVVDAVAESLPALSSGVPDTVAVFVNVIVLGLVFAGTETTIETVAELAPAANVPRLQTTVAVPVHVPVDGVADTNVVPAGSVSVTATPVAAVFPVCDAVIE
jgi:hypothetical protein